MTPHEDDDAHVIDLTLRALPPVSPFVVRWNDALFTADQEADPAALKAAQGPQKKQKPTAKYRSGSAAQRYGKLVEKMPPLANSSDAEESPTVDYIREQITAAEGSCSVKEARRIFYCFANMKKNSPIIFDRATGLWRGRNHGA